VNPSQYSGHVHMAEACADRRRQDHDGANSDVGSVCQLRIPYTDGL